MKKTVGVREAKARFSQYVALARAGAEVVVTDRGRPVAKLVGVPVGKAHKTERDVFDALDEAGFLDRGIDGAVPSRRLAKLAAVTDVTEIVREQRR